MNNFALPNIVLTPKFYTMDPQTETVIPDGEFLRDGMRVLVESSSMRVDVSKPMRDWEMERALENNQWCTVSYVKVDRLNNVVHFVGTYGDGTQKKRSYGSSYAWLVKKDSIRSEDQEEKREKVQLCLMATITDTMQMAFSEELSDDEKTSQLSEIVEKATDQILDLL
jgi:hypothetical protein